MPTLPLYPHERGGPFRATTHFPCTRDAAGVIPRTPAASSRAVPSNPKTPISTNELNPVNDSITKALSTATDGPALPSTAQPDNKRKGLRAPASPFSHSAAAARHSTPDSPSSRISRGTGGRFLLVADYILFGPPSEARWSTSDSAASWFRLA